MFWPTISKLIILIQNCACALCSVHLNQHDALLVAHEELSVLIRNCACAVHTWIHMMRFSWRMRNRSVGWTLPRLPSCKKFRPQTALLLSDNRENLEDASDSYDGNCCQVTNFSASLQSSETIVRNGLPTKLAKDSEKVLRFTIPENVYAFTRIL